MIGEDGRMNDVAGSDYEGLTAAEAQQRVVADLRDGRGALRRGAIRPLGPVLAPLRTADRAADQPPVVLPDGRAREARDRRRPRRRDHVHPRALGEGLPRLDGEHPPLVRLPAALVGASAPGLVLRPLRGRRSSPSASPTATSASRAAARCAATTTSSTPGSARRSGRSRRSAGPRTPPELRAFYPTDVLVDGPRHHLPLGRADDHVRDRVPRRDPVHRRLHPLGHPGSGRSADVEEPRHRDRPARADRLPRRRRPPLRPAGDVLEPGRPLLGGEGPAGPRPRQQALERLAADPAQRRRRRARPAPPTPSRTAGSSPGSSGPSSSSASASTPSTSLTPRSSSTGSSTRELCDWYLEIVKPRLYDGEHGDAAPPPTCCTCSSRTLAMAHPLMPFVTEEIWSYLPGRELGADRRPLSRGRRRSDSTPRPRRRWRPRSS